MENYSTTIPLNETDVIVSGGGTSLRGNNPDRFDQVLDMVGLAADVMAPAIQEAGRTSEGAAIVGSAMSGLSTVNSGYYGNTLSSGYNSGYTGTSSTGYVGGNTSSYTGNPSGELNQQEMMQNFVDQNFYFLVLQQEVQQQSREFQTLSNVMKTKHDSEVNSIRNMRT